MPASCSAASPASRASSPPLRSGYRPNRTIPTPATAMFSSLTSHPPPRSVSTCAQHLRTSRHRTRGSCCLHRLEAVDHDVVAVVVRAEDLELELQLHADAEVVGPAHQDRLHAGALREVDLTDAVGAHLGIALGEERDVHVGPRVELAAGAELEVVGALVQARRAHVAP